MSYGEVYDPQPGEHPLTYSQTLGAADLHYGQTQASMYIQDDIRVASRVTANVGLSSELQSITDARTNFAPRLGAAWDLRGD